MSAEQQPRRRRGLPRDAEEAHATTPEPESSPEPEPTGRPAAADAPPGPVRRRGLGSTPEATHEATHEPVPEPAPAQPPPAWRRWAARGTLAALAAVVLVGAAVLLSRWYLGTDAGADFVSQHPGQYAPPAGAPHGYPWWLNWAHFLNLFLMVLVIRTGLSIRTETRPPAQWSPRWNPARKISLTIWTHQVLDLLWVLNGALFVLALFLTGHWVRLVPTSWEVFPNAVSAGLQYLSLDWPTEVDWAHYNSLQELAYFTTVFIAAPLAIITGVRLSGLWPAQSRLNRAYPVELARAIHLPVMVYFLVFIIIHVAMVLATDALRNLNRISTGQDVTNWTGFWLFVGAVAVTLAAMSALRPALIAPVASLFGRVGR